MKSKLLELIIMGSKFLIHGLILQVVFIGVLLASNSNGQSIKKVDEVFINLRLNNVSLSEAFKAIESKSNFLFSYDKADLDNSLELNLNFRNTSIYDILLEISKHANLHFRQTNLDIDVKRIKNNDRNKPIVEITTQTRTVSGKVTSLDDGEGLPGVNVVEKGTNNGTVTNVQGEYSLQVSDGATLVFSSVGFTTEEIVVGNRSTVDVVMNADIQQLQELVVVGYDTQMKKDITGSIATVEPKEMTKQPNQNFQAMLEGRVAGLQVTNASGSPGSNISVNIRGSSSALAGTDPLYVIDGVQLGGGSRDAGNLGPGAQYRPNLNPLSLLNPNDIESIQVLKDASATAIYGARGANGVIIITTKRGSSGETSNVNFDAFYGVQNIHNRLDLMNGSEHAAFLNEYLTAIGSPEQFTSDEIAAFGEGTDWQNEIYEQAPMQNYMLSMSGSSNGTNYYLSGSYFDQRGVVLNTGLKRYTIRTNLDKEITKDLKVSTSITLSRTINNVSNDGSSGIGNLKSPVQMSFIPSPTESVFNDDGEYNNDFLFSPQPENHVYALRDITSELVNDNLLGSVSIDYKILDNLVLSGSLGVDLNNSNGKSYLPARSTYQGLQANGQGYVFGRVISSWINEYTLTYSFNVNDHVFKVLGGTSLQRSTDFQSSVQQTNFINDDFGIIGIGGATGVPTYSAGESEGSLVGFIGRVNYDYKGKYLLTASIRHDGSSVFAPERKWGTFPSFSAGWRLSEEQFLSSVEAISEIKIRAGYGITGNQAIGRYLSFAQINLEGADYIFDGTLYGGSFQSSLQNADLGWEETRQTNLGVDISLFKNNLNATIDVYDKTTSDMLLFVQLPFNTGYSQGIFNTGSISNRGVEVSLGANLFSGKGFQWNTELNFTSIRNEVVSFEPSGDRFYAAYSDRAVGSTAKIDTEGQPFGSFFGYVDDGVWNTQAEIDAATDAGFNTTNISPGDPRYVDLNNDNEITTEDRTIIGNPFPDYSFGFNNNFSFKNFTLTAFIIGSQGFDILNGPGASILDPSANAGTTNKHVRLLNRWTPDNTSSNIPRAGAGNARTPSSMLIEDGSFVKLQTLMLSYNLSNLPAWLNSANFYISGQNLLTFTNYSGIDPSVHINGIDVGSYPTTSIYTLGVKLGF